MGLRACISKFPGETHATLHGTMLCVAKVCTTASVEKVITSLLVGGTCGLFGKPLLWDRAFASVLVS